jgi:hypothetical protein
MDYLRDVKVTIEKDTNTSTTIEVFEILEGGDLEDFVERIYDRLQELMFD